MGVKDEAVECERLWVGQVWEEGKCIELFGLVQAKRGVSQLGKRRRDNVEWSDLVWETMTLRFVPSMEIYDCLKTTAIIFVVISTSSSSLHGILVTHHCCAPNHRYLRVIKG